MNGALAASHELVAALREAAESPAAEMLLCPPFVYVHDVVRWVEGARIAVGAQDVSEHTGTGAYTGEIAGAMLHELGCRYVIVGHSERRTLHAEDDALVARKFAAAQAAGLKPILCVGETLAEREAGETSAVVRRQLGAVIEHAGIEAFADAVLAYEPVWAIGTGRTAKPAEAEQVHAELRAMIAAQDATIAGELHILYGGSMKAANARELLAMDNIDGGLVGGASLIASEFIGVWQAAVGLRGT